MNARAPLSEPEQLIEAGDWKRARALAEGRPDQVPGDALAHFLLSQIRYAFGARPVAEHPHRALRNFGRAVRRPGRLEGSRWVLTDGSRQNPDDLVPYYRAAEHILIHGRDAVRAERYLRVYLSQEPEGNEPSVADAQRKLNSRDARLNDRSRGGNGRAASAP